MILGVDPKNDFAFKRVFGSDENKPVLIDLLNAVLGTSLTRPLDAVDLLNPFNNKEVLDDKLSIFDIKARDSSGRWYKIEMQMAAHWFYPKRVVYYWSKLYQQQMHERDAYAELLPTISISFINGKLFPGTEFHREFILTSRQDPSLVFCHDLSIHTIELPKFAVTLESLKSPLERWCYFLRYGETLETTAIPEPLRTPPIQRAVEALRVMTQTEIERERYESRQKAIHDEISNKAEWERRYAESARKEEEVERKSRELERKTLELERKTLELERKTLVLGRNTLELERKAQETERRAQETERRAQEAERKRQETLKLGQQEQLVQSLERGLELKFGEEGKRLGVELRSTTINSLLAIQDALYAGQSIEDIRKLIRSAP